MTKSRCEICDITFRSRANFITHRREKHTEGMKMRFMCKDCGKRFVRKNNMQQHARTHLEKCERRFECPHCDFKANQRANMARHIMRKHELPFLCKKPCRLRFPTKEALVAHQQADTCANSTKKGASGSVPTPKVAAATTDNPAELPILKKETLELDPLELDPLELYPLELDHLAQIPPFAAEVKIGSLDGVADFGGYDSADSWCDCPHLESELCQFGMQDEATLTLEFAVDQLNDEVKAMQL